MVFQKTDTEGEHEAKMK